MKPRYYQTEAHNAAWEFLGEQAGNPVIVLPTGAGKSLVIAMLIEQARKFDARVIVLQHRKELILQNADKIRAICPDIAIGINSAGIGSRDYDEHVVFAGIQSVYKKAPEFGRRELIVIDEAHLVGDSDSSRYGQFLGDIATINTNMRIVGLTATAFRMGEGSICGPDKLFQRICYESKVGELIEEGFLCPVTNKITDNQADLSGVRTSRGDYNESDMQSAFMEGDLVNMACAEAVNKCADRKSILVFSSGVEHAHMIADSLRDLTAETVRVITGETLSIERTQWLNDFKDGKLRWLVNCMVLTTGFDAPCIDAIAVLRATQSAGLFAQIVGRGLRQSPGKTECVVLDFGGNIKRHGPIDSDDYGKQKSGGGGGDAPQKTCPNCEESCAISARVCEHCGLQFPPPEASDKHDDRADGESHLLGKDVVEEWQVTGVAWTLHRKRNDPDAPPTLRVIYECEPDDVTDGNLAIVKRESISEWVCFEHHGYAREKAVAWWETHSLADVPDSIEDAIILLDRGCCRTPATITTTTDGKWKRISERVFGCCYPREHEWNPEPAGAMVSDDEFFFLSDDEVPF